MEKFEDFEKNEKKQDANFNYDEFIETIRSDTEFVTLCRKQNRLEEAAVFDLLQVFIEQKRALSKQFKDFSDFKSNFWYWLPKHILAKATGRDSPPANENGKPKRRQGESNYDYAQRLKKYNDSLKNVQNQ